MRNQRTTRRRTFSVSVARSAWVIGRAGSCLRRAACPQEGRRPATGWHDYAVGRARMQVHVVIERRSEAVQKGDSAESPASHARPVAGTGRVRRGTKQPLDLFDEDPREGRDCVGPVSEEAAQPLRHGDHPLPHGHRGNDAVDEMRSCLCHPAAVAGGTDAAALAGESHDKTLPARSTACPAESEAEDAAGEVRRQLPFDMRRNGLLSDRPILDPAFEVLCDDLVKRRLLRPASLVAAGTRSADVRADFGPRRRRSQDGDHGRTGAWTREVCARTLFWRQG